MPIDPSYTDALSTQAKKSLSTQYGQTGYKYGAVANWKTIFQLLWLYFVKKKTPIEALFLTNHPLQLHYGIWNQDKKQTFNDSIRHATDLAFAQLNLMNNKKAHILHAGCGWGGAEIQLAKKYPWLDTVGVSIDQNQILIAQRLAGLHQVEKQAQFYPYNFLNLPKNWKNKFDGCLALESLCHVPTQQLNLLFNSLLTAIKPQSKLVVHDLFVTNNQLSTQEQKRLRAYQKGWDLPGTHHLSSFCQEAEKAEFKVIKKTKLTSQVLKSCQAIYQRATIATPFVKSLQNNQQPLVNRLGLNHPQLLDFVVTNKVQRELVRQGVLDYFQVTLMKK